MASVRRNVLGYWTRVERVTIDAKGEPQVQSTTCCCKAAGGMRRICARVTGNKTPCRCACHANAARKPVRP